jgi:hypothetical protein
MDATLFERLLYEEEGQTLDFKKEQYPFAKTTEEEKSELLKDILSFANAWRRSDAYILIGVEEVRGGRSNVVGILESEHLADHSLQQFVNHLANRPIQFAYEAFGFEGKQVGIIKIEQQTRPFYLKRDFGKLAKEVVYVRRGSSTCKANLDEVARMGQPATCEQAELDVQFAATDRDAPLGKQVMLETEFCEMPSSIPDLRPRRNNDMLGVASIADQPNVDFYRQMAEYVVVRRLFRPVRIVVANTGGVVAKDVRVELTSASDNGHRVMSKGELPRRPYRDRSRAMLTGITPIHERLRQKHDGETLVRRDSDNFKIEVECGDLQPGRKVWSDVFFLGQRDSGTIQFIGSVLAENLSKPKAFNLTVSVTVAKAQMSMKELARLPDAGEKDDEG